MAIPTHHDQPLPILSLTGSALRSPSPVSSASSPPPSLKSALGVVTQRQLKQTRTTMAQDMAHLAPEYLMPELSSYNGERYFSDETSANSSPSPIMSIQHMEHVGAVNYSHPQEIHMPFPQNNYAELRQAVPYVEFTDLTAPYQEDRRRKRSQARDEVAITSMQMRRRAQNRASQRAFRERKEKHAQDLQRQLDELHAKHKELQESHDRLGNMNQTLLSELEDLRGKTVLYRLMESDQIEEAPMP